jgi:hypothetical protein
MHTKIDPEFYDLFHHLPTETKFSMLWMLTNRGMNIAGLCSVTEPRFKYETGLDWSHFDRACKAFGNEIFVLPSITDPPSTVGAGGLDGASTVGAGGLDGAPTGGEGGLDAGQGGAVVQRRIWFRSFVRKQVTADGPSLAKNSVAKALVRAVDSADSPELLREFLLKYPSLAPLFSSSSEKNHTPPQGGVHGGSTPPAPTKRGEESNKRGEERHGEEGVQRESPEPHEPSSPENKKPRAPEDIVPAPEVLQRLGPIFGRQKNARASHVEETLALSLHASEEELALVEAYYRMAVAEPEVFYPKRSLSALLHDFPSQCDRARAHFAADPLFSPQKNSAAAPEPEGWREVVLAKYPRALVHEYRSWFDLDRDIRREFPQFPEDRHPAKKPASAPEPAVCGPTPAAA